MRIKLNLVLIVCAAFMSGCANSYLTAEQRKAAEVIDEAAKYVEEYGTASISHPILSRPTQTYTFGLNRTAEQYFDSALQQRQGAISALSRESLTASIKAGAVTDELSEQKDKAALDDFQFQQKYYQERLQKRLELQATLDGWAAEDLELAKKEAANELDAEKKKAIIDAAIERQTKLRSLENLSAPTFPTTSTLASPSSQQNVKAPTALAGLLDSFAPTLSNRNALHIAAGDKATQAIYNILGEPEQALAFEDNVIFFAVVTVSVNPGWRTRENFVADLVVRPIVTYEKARKVVVDRFLRDESRSPHLRAAVLRSTPQLDPGNYALEKAGSDAGVLTDSEQDVRRWRQPLAAVMTVSPMNGLNVLDMRSGRQEEVEIALSIAAALSEIGQSKQAEFLTSYAKSLQRHAASVTSENVFSAYSIGGTALGFQFGPAFQAVGIDEDSSESEVKLSRQTIPVLLIISFNPADLEPVVAHDNMDHKKLVLMEPKLTFIQTSNWQPLNWWSRLPFVRGSVVQRVNLNEALKQTTNVLAADKNALIKHQSDHLRSKVGGHSSFVSLDPEVIVPLSSQQNSRIAGVFPTSVSLDQKGNTIKPLTETFALVGEGLSNVDISRLKVLSPGQRIIKSERLGDTIGVTVEFTSADGPLVFECPLKDANSSIYSFKAPVKVMVSAAD